MSAKRVLSVFASFLLVLCLTPAAAFAEVGTQSVETQAVETQATYDGTFTFSDSGITASDDSTGYAISETALTINAAGTYYISGSCSEGNIKVKKGTTGVTIVLGDLTLSCSSTTPLAINKNCGDTTLQVEGAVVLTDAEDPANETSTDTDIADAFEGAAIKVKTGSNLTITGSGTLTVDGSACKNGIKGGTESELTIGATTTDSITVAASAAKPSQPSKPIATCKTS